MLVILSFVNLPIFQLRSNAVTEENILKYYLIIFFSHCYPSHALQYSTLKTGPSGRASVWNGEHKENPRKRKGQVIGL